MSRRILHGSIFMVAMGLALCAAADEPSARSTEALAFNCFTCHGTDGKSPGDIPALYGKSAESIRESLRGFKNDTLEGTLMTRIAKGYSDEEIDRIAEYLSGLK